ncbi:hypothetical protein V1515DRAFT_622772 [Lipomyces mesembrius]
MKELNLTPVTALRSCTGIFARTMGMPCGHIITCQWRLSGAGALQHGDIEPVDYRLWVQNPERIRPRGRPGTLQQMTYRSTRRVPSGFEVVEDQLHAGESSQRGRVEGEVAGEVAGEGEAEEGRGVE